MKPELLQQALRELSGLNGDYALCFRAVVRWIAELLPACSQALVLNSATPRLAALALADGSIAVELEDPLNASGELLVLDDRLSQHLLAECSPGWLRPSALELETASACLFGNPKRVLRLPVYGQGRVSHLLLLGFAEDLPSAPVSIDTLVLFANAAVALTRGNVRAGELHQQNQQVLAEVRDLVDVQRALLPDNPELRGLDYAIHYQPSALAGGDYYDLVRLNHRIADYPAHAPDVVVCTIADVSGHGAGAAMEAVQFDAIMRTYRGDGGPGPAGAMSYANRHFFSRRSRGHFMTVLGLLLQPDEGVVRFCSAGHPPFLRWSGGRLSRHGQGLDIPLGILREHAYSNDELPYVPGDVYVLLTDGICEARNGEGQEFGLEAVEAIVSNHASAAATELRDRIISALHAHQGSPVGRDDQTMLVLRLVAVDSRASIAGD